MPPLGASMRGNYRWRGVDDRVGARRRWKRRLIFLYSGILESVFGPRPACPFTVTDINDSTLKREYMNIVEMADEHKNVRVWGGIHFRNALEAGEEMGRKIAAYLLTNALRPVR